MIYISGSNRKGQFRGAAVIKQHKWPNNEIPYDISAITSNAMILSMYLSYYSIY